MKLFRTCKNNGRAPLIFSLHAFLKNKGLVLNLENANLWLHQQKEENFQLAEKVVAFCLKQEKARQERKNKNV